MCQEFQQSMMPAIYCNAVARTQLQGLSAGGAKVAANTCGTALPGPCKTLVSASNISSDFPRSIGCLA